MNRRGSSEGRSNGSHLKCVDGGNAPYCVLSVLLPQVEAFDTSVNLYGQFAFLLWRSVYITKQVGGVGCHVELAHGCMLMGSTTVRHKGLAPARTSMIKVTTQCWP